MKYPPEKTMRVILNTLTQGGKLVSYTEAKHPDHIEVDATIRLDGVDTRLTCEVFWVGHMGGGWMYRNVVRHG